MPNGYDRPTSSSVSRMIESGSREQHVQLSSTDTRRGRLEVSIPKEGAIELNSLPVRPRPTKLQTLESSEQPSQTQKSGTVRQLPAYLRGKNPYGQVLSSVEHPYQGSQDAVITAAKWSSQDSVSAEGKSDGPYKNTPRSKQFESEQRTIRSPITEPEPSSRQSPRSVSVQATRNLFEIKASQDRSPPPLPPASAAIIAKGVTKKDSRSSVHSSNWPIRLSNPTEATTLEKRVSGTTLLDEEQAKLLHTPEEPKAGKSLSDVAVKKAIAICLSPSPAGDELGANEEQAVIGRKRSLKTVADNPQNPALVHFEHRTAVAVMLPAVDDHSCLAKPHGSTEETVKRCDTVNSSSSFGYLEKSETPVVTPIIHVLSEPDTCKAAGRQDSVPSRQLRRQGSRSVSSVSGITSRSEATRLTNRRLSETSKIDAVASRHHNVKPSDRHGKVEAMAARGLSHDGPGSVRDIPRYTAPSIPISIADIGIQDDYQEIQVPNHVDWRGAYGRRKTQDFGFPGARIKPRSTLRYCTSRQDPKSCTECRYGYSAHMCKYEASGVVSRRGCEQYCLKPTLSDVVLQSPFHCGRRSSSRSPHFSWDDLGDFDCPPPAKCIPSDQCGNGFAEDMGVVIDSIRKEHANALQSVIDNIKHSRPNPNLTRLTWLSPDPASPVHSANLDLDPQSIPQHPPYQAYHPHTHTQTPPYPSIPPKAIETLNVGLPGQTAPNMNDSPASLQASITSISELIHLVCSAADDLGLDLRRRPSARDDRMFQDAPFERSP